MANETSDFIIDGFEGINTQFSDFEEVGRGAHNILMRARRYGRWWMLKCLLPEEANQPVFQKMLCKEAELMLSLDHPNIVRSFGVERVADLGVCIVMDWVDGLTLQEYSQRVRPSKHTWRRLMHQLLDAVNYLHTRGIVHRDLKPQNIMVTNNGANIRLIDFGLADSDNYAMLKQPGGTTSYMAPEQAAGGALDVRNDIYSLGRVMQELPLGRDMERVVRHCLLPIDRRYRNIDEMTAAIRSSAIRRRWMWVATAVVAAAAIMGGMYLLRFLTAPSAPTRIVRLDQLLNDKQYIIHTRDYIRGGLGVFNHELATTWENAQYRRTDSLSTFAILKYGDAYFLYNIPDHRFFTISGLEIDAPLACSAFPSKMDILVRDSLFVFDFRGLNRPSTLNTYQSMGSVITNERGTATGVYDDGNMFVVEEVGDFDPTEALSNMKEPNEEFEAARKAIVPEMSYAVYTEKDARRYYLGADGRLKDHFMDSCRFTFHCIEGDTLYRSPAFCLCYHPRDKKGECNNGFSCPFKEDNIIPTQRGLLDIRQSFPYSWKSQVFFQRTDGFFAIRCTASPQERFTAGAYWAVYDFNNDGIPEVDYSTKPAYVWKLEAQ